MLTQIYGVTLRLLLLRAGPQDLPYAPSATPLYAGAMVLLSYLAYALVTPGAAAAMAALGAYAGLALLTRELLRARKLSNRYEQTLHALLAASVVFGLLTLWPFAQVAPVLVSAAANPAMLEHPDRLPLPDGPMLVLNLLAFWKLAVTAHIYRQAVDSGFGLGLLVALMLELVQLSMMMLGAVIARLLFG